MITLCLVSQSCLTLCNPMDCSLPGFSVHGDSPGKNTGEGGLPPPGDLPNPGIKPRSPALQADSLPSKPPGKPKNTGVGSLSLLQGNFPTQESTWGLLPPGQILYQLSYQGGPVITLGPLRKSKIIIKVINLITSVKSLLPCKVTYRFRSDQISRSVVSDSLLPHESQHARPPCPSPTPGVHSDSRPSSQ